MSALERHFAPIEIAKLWNLHPDAFQRVHAELRRKAA
jgi:hypothetical protein